MILIEEELSLIEAAKEYLYTFLSEFGEFLPLCDDYAWGRDFSYRI